jgi:hypothetical protein
MALRESNKEYYQRIIDMLVAGGYFRARIDGLDPFDKVVGGLVWGITASGVALEVQVFFEENATLGQRIEICEAIDQALVSMKCPYRLMANQLSSLNYKPIFPAIQWLVKHVIDYRRITGNRVRDYSIIQYDKGYDFTWFDTAMKASGESYVRRLADQYTPKRQFRKDQTRNYAKKEAYVDATLLEYGVRYNALATAKFIAAQEDERKVDSPRTNRPGRNRASTLKGKAAALESALGIQPSNKESKEETKSDEKQEDEENTELRLDSIQKELLGAGKATKVSGKNLTKIVGLDAENITDLQATYKENISQMDTEIQEVKSANKKLVHEKKMNSLRKQVEALEAEREQALEQYTIAEKAAEETSSKLEEKEERRQRIVQATAELVVEEQKSDNKEILSKLKELVMLNEKLKAQEKLFKEDCKKQLDQMKQKLAAMDRGMDPKEEARLKKIDQIFETDKVKFGKARQILADKNQEIARVTRRLDSYPTRAELLQYERRFVELYEQTAERLKETKKYFDMYNTLNDVFDNMEKEVKLLENVREKFNDAITSAEQRTKLKESFSNILTGIQTMIEHHTKELEAEKLALDMRADKESKLLQRQRKYYQAIKEFQEACYKNERLQDLLSN